jgi:6-phospho-3-hexuloisomerase
MQLVDLGHSARSLFETAQMIAFELAILKLRPRFGETSETMRERHTNLE